MHSKCYMSALVVLILAGSVFGLYDVSNHGDWPNTWPTELEFLRKQARTFNGPRSPQLHFEIPFAKRDDFEAAWPHLVKVKSKGAQIVLVRKPRLGQIKAGIWVHCPPMGTDGMTYLELVVDGEIVDLNRIALPENTPILDQRFPKPEK